MKKFYLLSFFALVQIFAFGQSVQITNGAGGVSGSSGNIVVGQNSYHVSESIYTENEIGASQFVNAESAINKIGYFVAQVGSPTQISSFKVWMKNVSASTTEFAAGTYSTAGYTLVFDGAIEPTDVGEYFILLNTPFVRTAGSNLQVMVERLDGITNTGFIFYSANGNDVSGTALSSRRVNQATAPTAATNLSTTTYRPAIDLVHVFADDAAIADIQNPTISCYGTEQTIGVVVANDGLNSIPAGAVTVSLNISGANTFNGTATNTAAIAPGAIEVVNFAGINLNNPGQNADTVFVSYAGDINSVNDSVFTNTNTSEVLNTFPINEDAETTPLAVVSYTEPIVGNSSYWSLNQGAYSNSATASDSLSPRAPGTTFYLFDSYNALEGIQSRLYSKCIELPAGSPSIKSTFWMSHDSIYAIYPDSMYVSISTDKGLTWTRLKGLGRVDANAAAYYWAQDSVDLTSYAGQTVQLAFEGVSYYGNSFGLDDINITACPTTGFNATTAEACYSYNWATSGQTYTQSGTYTYTYATNTGCPGVDTLYLTINVGSKDTTTVAQCDAYVWSLNNQTYTQSGTYSFEETVAGQPCPTLHTLILDVQTTNNSQTVAECDQYTWTASGETYTISGDYTYSYVNGNNCPSVDTLHLTINHPTNNTQTETACDSYTWQGTAYTAGGDYTYSYTNTSGCPSVDTLHLTINASTHQSIDSLTEAPITWNGINCSTSGTYTYSYTNSNGCPSVDTLHLIINIPVTSNSFAYPNPSNGHFKVRYDNNSNTDNPRVRFVTVYDSKGVRLFSKEVGVVSPAGDTDIDMSAYPKGLYNVELGDFSKKRIASGKVIIQ